MSIIVRSFNFWAHVSAETTTRGLEIYLNAGDCSNEVISKQEKKYLLSKLDRQMLLDNKIMNSSTGEAIVKIKINNQKIFVKINIIETYQNISCFILDRIDVKEKIKQQFPEMEEKTKNCLINYLGDRYIELDTSTRKLAIFSLPYFHRIKTKDDRITLPSKQDGYQHGFDEKKFQKYVLNIDVDEFCVLKNNCADHIISALEFADNNQLSQSKILQNLKKKIYIRLCFLKIRNPNIWILGKTFVQYARALREEILNKTIADQSLSPVEKIRQILKMEIQRLDDGEHNIKKNSMFCFFRNYSVMQKSFKKSC